MSKKFLAGVFAVAAFAFAMTVSAAYDFGATTLRVGSKGEAVKAVQTVVGATPVDGIFGAMTKAKVMAWQAANGLVADGVFGPASKAKANATVTTTPTTPTTPSTPSTGLSGGAGDLTATQTSKNVESTVKEGDEEKVLALKVEADDSDIQITNLKLEIKRSSAPAGTESEKLADYVEEVKVYLGSTEVASLEASDFSRESGSPDLFTKSIALKNAVVEDGETEYLYVSVVAIDDIDSDDDSAKLTVTAQSVRFTDGTGAIMTDSLTSVDEEFGFKLSSTDDSLKIKSASANPDDMTVKVDEDDESDEFLALAFKLDVDDDSSDMDLQTIKVVADTDLALTADAAGLTKAEAFIDSVVLKIAGEEFEAEDLKTTDITDAGDLVKYTFDIDGDVTIDAGDVEEAKVYVTFAKQGAAEANYANGKTVKFSVTSTNIEVEADGDSVSSSKISGSQSGAVLTVNNVASTISNMKWVTSNAGTYLDFFFTVEADDDDFEFLTSSVNDAKNAGTAAIVAGTTFISDAAGVVSKYSGDATAVAAADVVDDFFTTDGFKVNEGDKATFRVRYSLGSDATTPVVTANNGMWLEVKVTSVAGQTVADDLQTSPTATVSL